MAYLKVLSNLNLGGTLHQAGTIIEDDVSAFLNLIEEKVLEVIEGAESLEDAKAIDAEKQAQVAKAEAEAEGQEPENTWGAKPDEDVTPPAEEVAPVEAPGAEVTAPASTETTATTEQAPELVKYDVVTLIDTGTVEAPAVQEIGTVVELDPAAEATLHWVEEGAIKIADTTPAEETGNDL
jgi:hypothetical protein